MVHFRVVFLFVLANLFEDVAEAFFWNEFEASFNFIAVDYLVYTKEVIGNIYESYPIIPILGGILAASVLAVWGMKRFCFPGTGRCPPDGNEAVWCCSCWPASREDIGWWISRMQTP